MICIIMIDYCILLTILYLSKLSESQLYYLANFLSGNLKRESLVGRFRFWRFLSNGIPGGCWKTSQRAVKEAICPANVGVEAQVMPVFTSRFLRIFVNVCTVP